MNAVQLRKSAHECVIRGLENGRQYFFHIRSRQADGKVSAASFQEKTISPQAQGKNYAISIYDNDVTGTPGICSYGWNNENGQGIPGYHNGTQNGKNINVVIMELAFSILFSEVKIADLMLIILYLLYAQKVGLWQE